MKRSAFDNLISQARNAFEECNLKFDKANEDLKKCGANAPNRQAYQLFKDMQFHRQNAVFTALNALTIAKDIFNNLGYLEED